MASSSGPPPTELPHKPHEPPWLMRVPVELLVVVCLLVGIFPRPPSPTSSRPRPPPWSAITLPAYDLAIWHGFNPPMIMSLVALVAGIIGYGPGTGASTAMPIPPSSRRRSHRHVSTARRSMKGSCWRSPAARAGRCSSSRPGDSRSRWPASSSPRCWPRRWRCAKPASPFFTVKDTGREKSIVSPIAMLALAPSERSFQ